jgi:hypothetical protein
MKTPEMCIMCMAAPLRRKPLGFAHDHPPLKKNAIYSPKNSASGIETGVDRVVIDHTFHLLICCT